MHKKYYYDAYGGVVWIHTLVRLVLRTYGILLLEYESITRMQKQNPNHLKSDLGASYE